MSFHNTIIMMICQDRLGTHISLWIDGIILTWKSLIKPLRARQRVWVVEIKRVKDSDTTRESKPARKHTDKPAARK